jgi:hypothetical protein
MKSIQLLLILFLFGNTCVAQGVFSNQTNNALERVVQNYPSQFKNIRGDLLSSTHGSSEYKSTVAVPGAISTTIIQTVAASRQMVCWQSVLYAGNGFTPAKARFEELFNQIKNTIIKPQGQKAMIVNGLYMDPPEDRTFTTIQFDLLPATSADLQTLNIDLMLKNTGKQWQIILSVYDKEMTQTDTFTAR